MKRTTLAFICLSLFCITFNTGCSSVDITHSWTRPGFARKSYQKILVLGLINEPDRSVREKIETHLAADLRHLGYVAVCACEEFQPNTFYGLTEAQMLAQMQENSFDAVMTVILLGKEKYTYPIYSGVSGTAQGNIHQLWNYYQNNYNNMYDEKSQITSVSYFWETNLYDLSDNGQVYSAQTKSFDPSSVSTMAHQYSLRIIKDMLKKDVLSDQSSLLKAF